MVVGRWGRRTGQDRRGAPAGTAKLSCPGQLVGRMLDPHHLQVRCRASKCRVDGYVTFHTFDIRTGECVTEHVPYRDPSELLGE